MDHSVHDVFLENHVLRRMEIESASACKVSCYMEADCVSYNLRHPRDQDGGYLCELSSSSDETHPFDVTYEKEAIYQSFQVRKPFCRMAIQFHNRSYPSFLYHGM